MAKGKTRWVDGVAARHPLQQLRTAAPDAALGHDEKRAVERAERHAHVNPRQVLSASTVIQSVPPGRVLALAVALGTGGIEHLLNPRPEPGSGFGYSLPERRSAG